MTTPRSSTPPMFRVETGACVTSSQCVSVVMLFLWSHLRLVPRKVRSNKDISKRQDEVTRFFERGAFSYSKWELAASHPVGAEMLDMVEMTMQRPDVRSLLTKMTGEKLNGIPDYFITTYAQGDFLSIHNDGNSGSMAWVIAHAHEDSMCSDGHAAMPTHSAVHSYSRVVQVINLSKDWEPQFGGNLKAPVYMANLYIRS